MKILNSDMELITLIFLISETIMFLYQLLFYLQKPNDKKLKYYLILLFLFVVYNLFGGLFPDPNQNVPIVLQNILAYGSGFGLACYFPYYFYKAYDLKSLKFHAHYGVALFLIAPFLLFLVVEYSIYKDIDKALGHALILPFIYAVIAMAAIFRAIRLKYKDDDTNKTEMLLMFISIFPWISMPLLSYLKVQQTGEVLIMNGGFLITSILFFWQQVKETRENNKHLNRLLSPESRAQQKTPELIFTQNCHYYKLTKREIDVAIFISKGLKYKDIADLLFISERTVTKHVQNIFLKAAVTNRYELSKALEADKSLVTES
ncbi:response regulator transcription factor [Pedobacter sp. NJ-S-72]